MITVCINSDNHGEGKTTVAGIVKAALQRCNYEVIVNPIPWKGYPPEDKSYQQWIADEQAAVTAAEVLLDEPERLHPIVPLKLEVHG